MYQALHRRLNQSLWASIQSKTINHGYQSINRISIISKLSLYQNQIKNHQFINQNWLQTKFCKAKSKSATSNSICTKTLDICIKYNICIAQLSKCMTKSNICTKIGIQFKKSVNTLNKCAIIIISANKSHGCMTTLGVCANKIKCTKKLCKSVKTTCKCVK